MADPFVTLDELKAYIDGTMSDPEGQAAIDAASEIVRRYCEREFDFEDSVALTLDGSGTDALILPSPPIRGVVSVAESGYALTEDVDFAVRAGAGLLRRLVGAWCPGVLNVAVTYHRGYDLDGISYPGMEAWPLPPQIRAATLSLAKRLGASGSLPVGGFSSEVIGQYQYGMRDPGAVQVFTLTADERAMLDPYRVPRLA